MTETIEFLESKMREAALIAKQQWDFLSDLNQLVDWPEDVRHSPFSLFSLVATYEVRRFR